MFNQEQIMDQIDVRFECLRLALDKGEGGVDPVEVARRYTDFVLGRNDADVIRVAHEGAEKACA